MILTQESILSVLIAEGGKVRKPDLMSKFRGSVDSIDPAEKERNRELFKTFVNNVAFVKEIDGVRYVVLRKTYQHLLGGSQTAASHGDETEKIPLTGEQPRPQTRDEKAQSSAEVEGSSVSEADKGEASESNENPTEMFSPVQFALQRSKFASVRVKRGLNFDINKGDTDKEKGSGRGSCPKENKPYALPLRMPPSSTRVETRKLKEGPDEAPESSTLDAFSMERRPPSVDTASNSGSTQLRRVVRDAKVSEEPRDSRTASTVPLEQAEHEWLVKCASGHWNQVHGLLLRDSQLAEKKDFMSGFTALHWAAKWGNSKMLDKIISISRQEGVDVDINVRAHGGYTPLHIAALHDQAYIMAMLVGEYGANVSIRDNCGKKAYHYLHKGISGTLREMLGEPKACQTQDTVLREKEELDLFPDISKSLHSFSRLFQPTVIGHKKKHKQRSRLYSLSENPSDEREDGGFRHRTASNVFA
ncbi:ankyrin repeat domain-containing protein SOWAHA [Odontesthes bonariensis]|uniref:ankyrin repeat domain-containing protein SOWAHA n=1 Tax=Odontesthes bonariensis TaxID=219752 RepID=UPI003F58E547